MRKLKDPFIDYLPKIDLHGYDSISAKIKVEEFINDNIKLKNKKIIIIHGIGEGIVKKSVYEILKRSKSVVSYKLNWNNPGITEVNLK